ncbi:MAG: hypothetical protein WC979_05820 [Candidatus Pacearchaeota archaeon]|jgi:hypothetical protein
MRKYLSSIGALLILTIPINYANANIPYKDRFGKENYFERLETRDFHTRERITNPKMELSPDEGWVDAVKIIRDAARLKEKEKARNKPNSPTLQNKVSK